MTAKRIKKPELLIPAGSLEVLKTAVIFGADAVYIGGEAFGLRAKAKNFASQEMAEGIAFAHAHGAKVHVTANILAHNRDLEGAEAYFHELKELRPDALIVADPGMFALAREICPEIDVHVSTQANNTNYRTFRFWHDLGARRVVSARELSLEEIREIRRNIPDDLEIECFIHGAMCISYSGRCLLSSYFTGRDANRGACTHPCRWKYAVMEETRPGEYLPVYENERGTYLFNSRDLCMIGHIPELIDAGIDSFKIEGRMKTALYVATVARTYRRAIDDCMESVEKYRANMEWYLAEIAKCTYRKYTTGFYFGRTDENAQIYDNGTYVKEYTYLGTVGSLVPEPQGGGAASDGETTSGKKAASDGGAASCREAVSSGEEISCKEVVSGGEAASDEEAVSSSETAFCKEVASGGETFHEKEPRLCARIEQRNKFSVGDDIEIMKPDGANVPVKVLAMYDEEGRRVESCPHARQVIDVRLSEPPAAHDILRVKTAEETMV